MLSVLSGTRGRIVAQAAVLTAVVGGSVAYSAINKSITINVDGQTREVSAFGGTVGDLLEDEDLPVGDKDLVAPGVDSDLKDGDTIVVRYARPLTLTVDGKKRTHWTTELSVDRALSAIGVRADKARLSASRSALIGRSGMSMWLSTPKQVTLTADGDRRGVTTTAPTVAELLKEQKLTVRTQDRLSTAATAPVTNGLAVTLVRIDTKRVTVQEKVPFSVTRQNDASMYEGEKKTATEGKQGSRAAVYDLVLTDGRTTSRKLVSARITAKPVAAVVKVGTKDKPAENNGGSSGGSDSGPADGLNWAALAECESGGNPKAVNPAGYYGLYQFSTSTWKSVGGSGLPSNASSAEQTKRAKILYNKAGRGQWPHCGKYL